MSYITRPGYNSAYNPEYYEESDDKRILGRGEPLINQYGEYDVESAIDSGPSCWVHLRTVFGVWILFGIIYWSVFTFYSLFYVKEDEELFQVTVYLAFAAMFSSVIVVVGIGKGIKLGTKRAAKWITPYCLVVSGNIWAHVYFTRKTNTRLPYSIAFVACDFVSMLYVSFVSYGILDKSKIYNKQLRIINFFFEWADLISQVIVSLVYGRLSSSKNVGVYEDLFWIFILIQLFFWVLPIIWGSGTNTKTLYRQILLLDFITDLPLLIINLASGAYLLSYFILADLLLKGLFMGRYLYVCLQRISNAKISDEPWVVVVICPFICDIE